MMKTNWILVILAILYFPHAVESSEFRNWTGTNGKIIEARLLKDNGNGTIQILRKDGWRGDVPLNLLSHEDQEYVKITALSAALEAADPVLSKDFEIFRIRRENVPGFISTKVGWEHKIECIKAELRYHGSDSVSDPSIRAYIYDKDGNVIEKFDNPPRRQAEGGAYVTKPESLQAGGRYDAYFPITLAMRERGWRTALIVFGNGRETNAVSMPNTRLIELDFDEKKIVFPDWSPEVAGTLSSAVTEPDDGADAVTPLPEMKTVKRVESPYATRVDNEWKSKQDSLNTEIRVKGALPSKVQVSAYFYDASKRLVVTRAKPAMTNLGGGFYSAVPEVARRLQWYPVYFPIDSELAKSGWNWAVIVYLADDSGVAQFFGPRGVSLSDFDFPGREAIAQGEAQE